MASDDGSVDEDVGDVDNDTLLRQVKVRPELYDFKRKDHHNPDTIARAWKSIGKEMNVSVYMCKSKWHSLRSSYGRYLRQLKKSPRKSKLKKWHLADDMSFLLPYMGLHRKPGRNAILDHTKVEEEEEEDVSADNMTESEGGEDSEPGRSPSVSSSFVDVEELSPKRVQSAAVLDPVEESVAKYLQSLADNKSEHPVLTFFKGLMPDVERLSQRSQRRFKTDIMDKLNYYVELEEDATKCRPR